MTAATTALTGEVVRASDPGYEAWAGRSTAGAHCAPLVTAPTSTSPMPPRPTGSASTTARNVGMNLFRRQRLR
jgi:hypothetical protein